MNTTQTLLAHTGAAFPILCGPMYPCSNPELIAAVSEAGGIGIIQPLSLAFVHCGSLEQGLASIRSATSKPLGFNVIVEKSVRRYEDRMRKWVDQALQAGIRFFVTSLGKPSWVVEKVHALGGFVYHDVTERKWAEIAVDCGVDGLICVNSRAGGHAGNLPPERIYEQLAPLGLPLVCAGGIGDERDYAQALKAGYAGVQMGTRFIATEECSVHADYKQAILQATSADIALTERITGVPVAVIKTPEVAQSGLGVSSIGRALLANPRTKHIARTFYALRSVVTLRKAFTVPMDHRTIYQAGKSVDGIQAIEPSGQIIRRFAAAVSRQAA